jgi:hypothetical protein
MYDVVVENGLVVYPEKTLLAHIGISGGKIERVSTKRGLKGKRSFDVLMRRAAMFFPVSSIPIPILYISMTSKISQKRLRLVE